MSEGDTSDPSRLGTTRDGVARLAGPADGAGEGRVAAFRGRRQGPPEPPGGTGTPIVSFDRHELREIFNLYGRRVAEGEWRDYAIDFLPDRAVFSIYRRASEHPLYRVEKDPALARRQGAYAVVAATGLILKRGPDLARVLQVLAGRPRLVVV